MLFGTTLLILGNIAVGALLADALIINNVDKPILPEPIEA